MTTTARPTLSHPDRRAATLANVAAERERAGTGPFAPPAAGARDARIDLKLLQWRALRAAASSAAARQRLREFAADERPDLWAGTVPDGVARGFAVALEEAIAVAPQPPPPPPADPAHTQTFLGKELRRKKDLLVASGGARIRFSHKEGVLFVDRAAEAHSSNCLRFEARRDGGTLDEFAPDPAERPRLFSAQFLQPVHYAVAPGLAELKLVGRLGRGRASIPIEVLLRGRESEHTVELRIAVENRHRDHRLRVRFLGIAPESIAHECTDVREVVHTDAGSFAAFTLVRANGSLLVDGRRIDCPGAQCQGWIEHGFRLGAPR